MSTQGEGRQRGEEGEGKSSLYGGENYGATTGTPNEQNLLHKDSFLHAALDIVIESQSVRFPMHLLVYVTGRAIIPRTQCPMLPGDNAHCYLHPIHLNGGSVDLLSPLSRMVTVM